MIREFEDPIPKKLVRPSTFSAQRARPDLYALLAAVISATFPD